MQTPKGLRRWVSAATDFTDHTPEANADKCEQPSPISVLEVLPYQEESPISDIKHEGKLRNKASENFVSMCFVYTKYVHIGLHNTSQCIYTQ